MEEWPEWILEILISNYEVMLSGVSLEFMNLNVVDEWLSSTCLQL